MLTPWIRAKAPWLVMAGLAGLMFGIFLTVNTAVQAPEPVKVRLEVDGTATNVTISYGVMTASGLSTKNVVAATLPWSVDTETDADVPVVSLFATAGAGGGTITCTSAVGDHAPVSMAASGAWQVANCQNPLVAKSSSR